MTPSIKELTTKEVAERNREKLIEHEERLDNFDILAGFVKKWWPFVVGLIVALNGLAIFITSVVHYGDNLVKRPELDSAIHRLHREIKRIERQK